MSIAIHLIEVALIGYGLWLLYGVCQALESIAYDAEEDD